MIYWRRPDTISSDIQCAKFFADTNCAKVSHVLSHELIRIQGKKRKEYFDTIHDLWNRHVYKDLSYNYYNERFIRVSQDSHYRFATLDISQL